MDCLLEGFFQVDVFQVDNFLNNNLMLAADSFWLNPKSWWAMAQVILGLGFVIFVHELGHFLVAKMCGVKCEKFYVGFDAFDIKIGDRVIIPKSLVKWQWGETEYGIGIVPLGGYVKMLGQDDNPGNMEKEIERSKIGEESEEDSELGEAGFYDRSKMDPRSFLAKSVPQRIAIISAGVIFNLIFGAIFAALAFKSGVNYEPTVVGHVVSGGPAWENDLSGVEVVRVGDKKVEGYFPFRDMAEIIALHGPKPIELEIIRKGMSKSETITVTPEMIERMGMELPLIGIQGALTPKVADSDDFAVMGQAVYDVRDQIQKKDLIVGVNDLPVDSFYDLQKALAMTLDEEVDFVLQRKTEGDATEKVTVAVGPNPRRETGLILKWGDVAAIRTGSPADKAGFQKGDEILEIDGAAKRDLYTLDRELAMVARNTSRTEEGETGVTFSVRRGDETLSMTVKPEVPNRFAPLEEGRPVCMNSIGMAINASQNIVESSDLEGINSGDEIVSVEVLLDDELKEAFPSLAKKNKFFLVDRTAPYLIFFKQPVPGTAWQAIDSAIQNLPLGTRLKIESRKPGTEDESDNYICEVATAASSSIFNPTRGVQMTPLQRHYQSETWGDAFKYGCWQTWNDCNRIFKFLKKLVVGGISPKSLGGPGTIAVVATSEASQGTSRLLLFLTLLSANLAIVNFLPIPVLDGGHFLFLCYEGLFRRPVSERVQMVLTYAGLFLILGLMAFVLYLDATRISGMM